MQLNIHYLQIIRTILIPDKIVFKIKPSEMLKVQFSTSLKPPASFMERTLVETLHKMRNGLTEFFLFSRTELSFYQTLFQSKTFFVAVNLR